MVVYACHYASLLAITHFFRQQIREARNRAKETEPMSRKLTFQSLSAHTLGLVVVLFLGASIARAQVVSGEITGIAADSSGAVIQGATVIATNVQTNVATQVETNSSGVFRVFGLIPGNYTLTLEKPNFKKFVRENVAVSVDTVVRVDPTLQLGEITESVTVTGAAPMLKTDKADVSETIGTRQVEDLPTIGRNITRLVQLAPGAVQNSSQLTGWPENAGEDFRVNINGQRDGNSNRQLDGVDNNETIQGLSMIVPSADSVQEVKITTSNYDAEFGQVAAAVIQVSTKSGTNDLHGSLFEFYRSSGLFASDPFTEPNGPPKTTWNQFGGSLGGPILKGKLFFFGDYQGMRSLTGGSVLATLPVEAFRTGDFSAFAATNPIFDPTTGNPDGTGRTQFLNNTIPADRISPVATNLLALLPLPTNPTALDSNFATSGSGAFNQNQFSSRIDYNRSNKTTLFGRYSFFQSSYDIPSAFGDLAGGPPLGGNITSGFQGSRTNSAVANYARVLSPSLVTDLRFAFARITMHNTTRNGTERTADDVGLPGINTGSELTNGLPQFDIGGPVGTFSFGQSLPFAEWETNVNVVNNWTKVIGPHSLKWGADIKKAFLRRRDTSGRGSMGFSQSVTGSADVPGSGLGMATFLLGLASTYNRTITLDITQEKQWRDGLYVQDRWAVSRKLTLSLGLRWEYFSPIFADKDGTISNLDTDTGNILIGGLFDKYAGVKPVYDEFAPRVGLAYRLASNTVIRGGFGRGYAIDTSGANFGRMFRNWPIQQNQNLTSATPFVPDFTLSQGPPAPAPIPPFPTSGILPMPNGTWFILYPGKGPYPHTRVDSWNVTIQHQLGNTTFELAYLGNIGRNLWGTFSSNAAVPGPGPFDPRRPFFNKYGWTQFLQLYRAMGSSNYNGLQAKVARSFSQGFSVLSTFTWSKALDEEGNYGFQNQFDIHSNYGPSDLNRSILSSTSFTWELPFGPGKPFGNQLTGVARRIAEGWSINGLITLQSGMPFTPLFGDTSSYNSDCCVLRPDRIGSGDISNPSRNGWFDPSAFTRPPAFTYGNSGRNILVGPGFATADLSLFKQFLVTERMRLDLRWEAFNALNRTNLANPVTTVDSSVAGHIFSILYPMRRMQIGAHLSW
jgi:Carboxypeptidase regulatory-like domain